MASGIYRIVNQLNNKQYIGSAVSLAGRKYDHFHTPSRSNPHLQRAIKKYGQENFKFEILELVPDIGNLILREQFYLDTSLKNNIDLYNIAKIAGSNFGVTRSSETRQRMSLAKMGHAVSERQRALSRQRALGNKYNLGKKRTPAQIENIRRGHAGQKVSEYTRYLSYLVRTSKPYWNKGLTK
ncbi:MAG: GIY-YIG nuclease family protein, partial [Nitrosotalea sp.]